MCNNGLTIKINLFWSKRFEDGRCTYKNTGSSHLKFHVSNSLSNIIIPQDSLEPGGRKRNTWKFNGQMGLMMLQVYSAIESTFPMVLQYVINSDLGALSSWFESEIELFLSQRSLENGSANRSDHYMETTLQRWERSQHGQRSLRLGSTSAIVAISAITWKPLSSDGQDGSNRRDRSDSKNTNMQCVRSPISRWLTPLVPRNHWIWHVLWTKFESTTAFATNFPQNIETITRKHNNSLLELWKKIYFLVLEVRSWYQC